MKKKMTFWDIVAPLYDFFEWTNGAYKRMINRVVEILPENVSVLELASGTGSISLAISDKVSKVLCTDLSANMLKIAKRKAKNIDNIEFAKISIYETGLEDNSFDIVIASQVLHLLDEPQKASAEIKKVAKIKAILPICLIKECSGFGAFLLKLYKFFGFNPKYEFDRESYKKFLAEIGFNNCEFFIDEGTVTMCVAVWEPAKQQS